MIDKATILLLGLILVASIAQIQAIRPSTSNVNNYISSFMQHHSTIQQMAQELTSQIADENLASIGVSAETAPSTVRHGRDTITLTIGYGPLASTGEMLPFFGNTGPKVPIIITSPQPIMDIEELTASYQKESRTPGSAAFIDREALAQGISNPKVTLDQVGATLKSTLQNAALFAADARNIASLIEE
ncbi:uncharacterized protein CMU_036980 [Cryptosporidium muris RN66]|uniref:Uncharacterized protein n=1 Tax=Cryptosporidium muris (strain RN66) TaxID=441375 RepID=B6AH33_CRYMR|nr:uncharacterized protein CMU_036980 [Cryptosporidium muris RN66]EEA07524.1 hypothetical protein, conserved [Cryptosporidium muris RN66]|eukprot:XP_002141873.1 hypothetical protein [Cryptosporidium muris RN66]